MGSMSEHCSHAEISFCAIDRRRLRTSQSELELLNTGHAIDRGDLLFAGKTAAINQLLPTASNYHKGSKSDLAAKDKETGRGPANCEKSKQIEPRNSVSYLIRVKSALSVPLSPAADHSLHDNFASMVDIANRNDKMRCGQLPSNE